MGKHSWKLLRAIFIICSSKAICSIADLFGVGNMKMFFALMIIVGMVGIAVGIVMGCIALREYEKDSRRK